MPTIRELRERKHWTQEQLAHETGLAVKTISMVEGGKVERPNRTTIRVIAQALGVAPEEITLIVNPVSQNG